jgi:hypothetical protein
MDNSASAACAAILAEKIPAEKTSKAQNLWTKHWDDIQWLYTFGNFFKAKNGRWIWWVEISLQFNRVVFPVNAPSVKIAGRLFGGIESDD